MSISSSASNNKDLVRVAHRESATGNAPVMLSERSITGFALIRIFVGYLWFQQLFWKLPPTFAGLYGYIVSESHHAIIPGYGALLQHTFLAGCTSATAPTGCTLFVPLAACVWTAELLVALSLMFGLFTRFGAILSSILALQLYVGLAYTDWIWTYGMLVLLGLGLVAIPAGRRLGVDQWLEQRLRLSTQTSRVARVLHWFV